MQVWDILSDFARIYLLNIKITDTVCFGAVGMKVVELERISMGKLKLPKDLKRGEYIELNLDDVSKIK